MVDLINIESLLDEVANILSGPQLQLQPQQPPQATPKLPESPEVSGYQAPLKVKYENSGNFSPNAPTDYRHKKHDGVDLRAPGGSTVYPITEGVVSKIGSNSKSGNYITIIHPKNVKSFYAHLGTISVKEGARVRNNTIIGTVGDSGNAKGTFPHIHFQVWNNNVLENPSNFFKVPPYSNVKPNEQKWTSDMAKQNAARFNLNNIKSKQAANNIDELDKLASIYYNLSIKTY